MPPDNKPMVEVGYRWPHTLANDIFFPTSFTIVGIAAMGTAQNIPGKHTGW
jgi:hypothetical protein